MKKLYQIIFCYLLCQLFVLISIPFIHEQILQKNYLWVLLLVFLMFLCFFLVFVITKIIQGVIDTQAKKDSAFLCEKLINERNNELKEEKRELLKIFQQIQANEDFNIDNIELFKHYCSYPLIDAVLKQKAGIMKKKNISYQISAFVPASIQADNTTVLAILMNILDNAIDASIKAFNPTIEIRIWTKGNYLLIYVKNSALHSPTLGKSSKNTNNHGLGLNIIRETCRKKSGLFTSEFDGKFCSITATIKLEEEK